MLNQPRKQLVILLWIAVGAGMTTVSWGQYLLTRSDICRIESEIKDLPGKNKLSEYSRVYAGRMEDGRYIVTGVLMRSRDSTVEIVPHEELPLVFDGGCDVITVKYDLQEKIVLSIRCNGEA